MLWFVIGGVGSGKSAFADELAIAVGREGFRLSCPSFPNGEASKLSPAEEGFYRTSLEADETLPTKIHAINMESNFFRAERRVVVIDSLAGWLRASFARLEKRGTEADPAGKEAAMWGAAIDAILAFEGKIVVVSEEPAAGLSPSAREIEYARRLAEANRVLLRASHAVYRLTAGMAVELKGYRLKGRNDRHENIHSDR
ncbi:bifunctional adenosylcobinamide kinase/adenosylcobinamide-phosphate guanylyltransferase [Cohnella hongkongensis]|uniref:Bifunctional adenosylcobinamide kinase/adenosylcobinamide-phosphate guanylyltransferase n=1 Tax=Cohnella hongkongensis TaxID=178337 RepID=A0ABV9FCE3_9BACL